MPRVDGTSITFGIRGPIAPEDVPGLCRRVSSLLERSGAAVAWCELHDVSADATAVDALARMQLAARRHGAQVRLRGASAELLSLIAFTGLADVVF
ncbi:MAG: STAS domain-containing protein [Solirubrobacterales bacterium]|nr:STAS domain-containing protein [Solirubrobacterales bacterium]